MTPHDPIPNQARSRVGSTLSGRYRLTRLIGIGGMAAVYAATRKDGAAVAVKILHERLTSDPHMERLFRREALLANEIRHPGVVPVIDGDVSGEGFSFLVMPLLEGETVRARATRLGGRLSLEEVVVLALCVLDTLGAAHERKIVHRDIKPENLFVTRDGGIRVLDFGIARFYETSESSTATRSGMAIGTPAYMAPEQARGRWGEVDGRTDLWALGATMFSLLTGGVVHAASSAAETLVLAGSQRAPPLAARLSTVPDGVARVVDRALEFEREQRWPDAASMRIALETAAKNVVAMPPSLQLPPPPTAADIADLPTLMPDARAVSVLLARHAAARVPFRRVATAALVIIASAIAFGVVRYLSRATPPGPPVAVQVPSDAETQYEAAVQAWHDGTRTRALLDRATTEDPLLASAHLLCVLTSDWIGEAERAHFHAAREYRSRLSQAEQAFLEAYEPAVRIPADNDEALRQLVKAQRRFPRDLRILHATMLVSARLNDIRGMLASADAAIAVDPAFAPARLERALALYFQGDVDGGVAEEKECLKVAPSATLCMSDLEGFEAREGDCEGAEKLARALAPFFPDSPRPYQYLGEDIYGRGGTLAAAQASFEQGWLLSSEDARKLERPRQLAMLAIAKGDFDAANAELREWRAAAAVAKSEEARFPPVLAHATLALELRDAATVREVTTQFLDEREAWIQSDYSGDYSIDAHALQYRAGLISRQEYANLRDAWLAKAPPPPQHTEARGERWLRAYANAVVTPDDAAEALAAMPQFVPLPCAHSRGLVEDLAWGRTLALGGRTEAAEPLLERAARSCLALRAPVEHFQSLYLLGSVLSQHDPRRACEAFARVLERWGGRSTTAQAARRESVRLRCASVPASE
jgi:serine/threonine-protein kinase